MRGIIFEDVYVPLYNGLTVAEGANVAGLSNSLANLAAGNTDFENNFYNGKKAYEQRFNQVKDRHPILTVLEEAAGGGLTGGGVAKLLKSGYRVAKILKNAKQTYPRRTREQWKADLEYGRQEFNKLRDLGPLKREGHPDTTVSLKSWGKIKQGNNRANYEMLQDVPDIYANGNYVAPNDINKIRTDDFNRFHWFEKDNKGIMVGENRNNRILYNVNSDVRNYLLEHPEKARELGIDITKL